MAGSYRTKQRDMLKRFLIDNAGVDFTVDEIVTGLRENLGDDAPGRSTIYRLIAEFEEKGIVKRFYREADGRAAFEYLDKSVCEKHLHIKCESCGQLYHLGDEVSGSIEEMLRSKEHVFIDMADTVLMGRCEKCIKGRGE
ncbi:MAG: transcriptional repressor [Clostridia bacterium]|nr:transcriptional repressor [Clostridia bacterium]